MRTDATRVCRNAVAVAVATRRVPARRSGGRRRAGHGTPRPQTGAALSTVGLVLALAVHVRSLPVDPQAIGLILVGAGVAWLWVPVRDKRAVLQRQFSRVIRYLSWHDGQQADRCSLAELLNDATPPAEAEINDLGQPAPN